MRLLKITNVGSDGKVDFELVSVYRPVPYAILSHTWDPDPDKEYLFDDARHATGETKPGYKKVQGFLAAAWNHRPRLEYGWVDTCCIDKSSSAELSEAINSMFQWYMDARVCLAYLADYDQVLSPDDRVSTNILGTCRWLTRGWTLQELLAPPSLIFYSADWQAIGTRSGLRDVVSKATGIHQSALKGDISAIRSFSIAQRMSWAATRDTTRLEDMAYCLLGIFDVNMPLLYGEGQRAFLRLQEEIIKDSDDQTIFCWHGRAGNEPDGEYSFFASHPSRFAYCQTIVPIHTGRVHTYQLTNAGLRVTARLQE
ncbi:heterokaryon incompatibility protein-domain-containing protein, partial [Echria macrotheca]